jgi:hypothetical protein
MQNPARTLAIALVLLVTPVLSDAQSAATAPLYQVLRDGFDGDDFSPEGGLYYRDNEEQRAGSYRFQRDTLRKGALELRVRPRCAASAENCSERAEIWEKTALRVPYSDGVWYGLSVKFGDPIPQDPHRYLIAQWKREIGPDAQGDFSPFLAVRMNHGKLFMTVETNYHVTGRETVPDARGACPAGQTPVWLRPETNQMRLLVAQDDRWGAADGAEFTRCSDQTVVIAHGTPLPHPESGWIDFAMFSQPGADGSGHVEVFANGKWIITIRGRIGHNDPGLGANQYFKFGPYREAAADDWTLYYSNFSRSAECTDVLQDAAACAAITY